MPCLRQTSDTVKPLARSRSASRSSRSICSALRRLLISPSLDSSQRTTITTGPTFGEPTKAWDDTTRRYRYTNIGNVKIESSRWRDINRDRIWLLTQLKKVNSALKDKRTVIPSVNAPNETHPDRNCMYTSSI